ncbi:MAG: tetratricopeptide repeat protein [Thermoguttaceae bacterium]
MRTSFIVYFVPFLILTLCTSGCFSAAKLQYASGPAPKREKRMSADEERLVLQQSNQYFATGLNAERRGDYQGAELAYLQCVTFNEKKKDAGQYLGGPYHRLAILAARKNDVKSAENYYHKALQYGGDNSELACDFAQYLCDQNRFQDAEIVVKNALITAPESRKLLFFAGHTLTVQNRPVEALRFLKESIGEANAYREIAAINRSLGKVQDAEIFEERALVANRTVPNMPELKKGEFNQMMDELEETPLELLTYGRTIADMGRISQRFDSIRGGVITPVNAPNNLGTPPVPGSLAQSAPTPVLPPPFPTEHLEGLTVATSPTSSSQVLQTPQPVFAASEPNLLTSPNNGLVAEETVHRVNREPQLTELPNVAAKGYTVGSPVLTNEMSLQPALNETANDEFFGNGFDNGTVEGKFEQRPVPYELIPSGVEAGEPIFYEPNRYEPVPNGSIPQEPIGATPVPVPGSIDSFSSVTTQSLESAEPVAQMRGDVQPKRRMIAQRPVEEQGVALNGLNPTFSSAQGVQLEQQLIQQPESSRMSGLESSESLSEGLLYSPLDSDSVPFSFAPPAIQEDGQFFGLYDFEQDESNQTSDVVLINTLQYPIQQVNYETEWSRTGPLPNPIQGDRVHAGVYPGVELDFFLNSDRGTLLGETVSP